MSLPTRRRCVASSAMAVLVGVSVAGCGADLHPGVAAVVNDTTVTNEAIDELSTAACSFTELNEPENDEPALILAELRTSLLGSTITFHLTAEAADEMGLSVPEAQIAKATQQQPPMPDAMPDDEADLLETFFKDAAKNQLEQTLIGAHLRDSSITTVDDARDADLETAQEYLEGYYSDQDVEISPRYGTWNGSSVEGGTGSLSDPVSTTAAEEPLPGQPNPELKSLPPSQVCG